MACYHILVVTNNLYTSARGSQPSNTKRGVGGPGDLDVHFFCNHIDTKYSNITYFKYHSVVFHGPKNYSMTLITIEGSKVIEEIERCMPLTTMPARCLGGN